MGLLLVALLAAPAGAEAPSGALREALPGVLPEALPEVPPEALREALPGVPSEEPRWQDLLARAADAVRNTAYAGEALWVTWADGAAHASVMDVRNTTDVGLVLSDPGRFLVRFGGDEAGFVHEADGWSMPLPVGLPKGGPADLELLAAKYEPAVNGVQRILDRRCWQLELRTREDGTLRERVWIDDATGLPLRRETYADDGSTIRIGVYLSLDLRPARPGGSGSRHEARPVAARTRVQERAQGVVPVTRDGLAALRQSGWVVPGELPGSYAPVGIYAVSADAGQPLQIVYRDGLYTVSLFQQHGHADWSSLPDGARKVVGLDWAVYEWPGAVPHRLVWEAQGRTFSLVGDAAMHELLAIVEALPRPEPPGVFERLRRGLGRLWSAVSPW